MENNVYTQLYDIANKNMQQSGNAFTHPKAAFLYYTRNNPHKADIFQLLQEEASNEDFLEIAYIAILNRAVDEEAKESWSKRLNLPEKKFRALVVKRLTASPECNICHKRIYNNIYAKKSKRRGQGAAGFLMQKLLPLYRRLPQGMKNGIRRIMGVAE